MDKNNTKAAIMEASLELFSVYGYEATSISQIADAVGLRKASLYSHFGSKQDILDKVLSAALEGYNQHSIFTQANWEDPGFTKGKEHLSAEEVAEMITGQIRYILHDPHISKGRKMLTIEQFRNSELAALQTKQNYTDVMRFCEGMVKFLIQNGVFREGDEQVIAAQFSAPITVWTNLIDREPEREEEVLDLIHRHVVQFFEVYKR